MDSASSMDNRIVKIDVASLWTALSHVAWPSKESLTMRHITNRSYQRER